jgi:hypothetical protein
MVGKLSWMVKGLVGNRACCIIAGGACRVEIAGGIKVNIVEFWIVK